MESGGMESGGEGGAEGGAELRMPTTGRSVALDSTTSLRCA